MPDLSLEQLCEIGAEQLMRTQYLDAIDTLAQAERIAWDASDFDTLSRVHMPLQEAHRQARLRCSEGKILLNLLGNQSRHPDAAEVLGQYSQGQLLIADWGSPAAAMQTRRLAAERRLYVEVFLAALFPQIGAPPVVAVLPAASSALPEPIPRKRQELLPLLPPGTVLLSSADLPHSGNLEQYVLELWEQLHRPFLRIADAETDLFRKVQAYRTTLVVDPACELAHQNLSIAARELARQVARG